MDTKTLQSKIAAMPTPVRDWYASEKLTDIVVAMDAQFKLSKENQSIIPKLLLRLAIKDLDAEYFSGELASQLNIDKNNALAITAEVKKTILSPVRKELSDYGIDIDGLEKFQMPILKPKILSEVKPPQAPSAPGPQIISEAFTATPKFSATPLASNKNVPAAPAPQPPKAGTAPGWSKATSQQPVVKLGAITPGVPMPSSGAASNTASTARPAPTSNVKPKNSMSEFERLDMMRKSGGPTSSASSAGMPTAGAPASKPAVPAAPTTTPSGSIPTPPPVMLHQVSDATAQTPGFQFKTGTENQLANKPSAGASTPIKPAVIEFGSSSTPAGGSTAPKAVHYSEYQPSNPSPTASTQNSGPRQVNEVTAPSAVPPIPRPPMPSTQPQTQPPQQNSKEKIIVKDFLG